VSLASTQCTEPTREAGCGVCNSAMQMTIDSTSECIAHGLSCGIVTQQVAHSNPLPKQKGALRLQFPVISVVLLQHIKVTLLVPLQALIVRLPHVGRDTPHAVQIDGFLHDGLEEMHGDTVGAIRREDGDSRYVELRGG
jgi:hypothetical protein